MIMTGNDVLSLLGSKTKFVLFAALMAMSEQVMAQSIDFDNSNKQTATGFTSWYVDTDGTTKSFDNGVQITLGTGSESAATTLKGNWWKDGVNKYDVQVCDGVTAYAGNNKPTSGKVSITVTIKGLSAGTHTLQAYHNYVEADKSYKVPPINVAVNGVDQVTGIAQTMRATSITESAKSYVTFSVTGTSQETVITYYTVPDANTSYFCTSFFINSLELGVDNADNQAQSPYPTDADMHVDADGGSVTLSWTASANTPSRHIVYFGESENSLSQIYSGTNTSTTRSGLNPMQTYYWRVDEVIGGTTYTGKTWSFRPRRLAFPGADGAGKYAQGGRGGVVYHVTSLADDASTPGTLRYGLEKLTGPRTIVFDVSGVIPLTSTLTCSDSYVTIAGQTAPGIGVMLRDEPFGSNSSDGQTRFMRFRYGHGDDWDGTSANQNTGNAAGLSADHGIMDHCMLGWGSDETFSSRGSKNYSFQHNIIGESLNQNGHKNYYDKDPSVKHGYAATVAGDVGSLHHNLLAHNEGRNWSLGGGLDASNNFAGRLNIYNNVVYNWGGRATDGGAHNVNFVGNYYKMGAATSQKIILSADHEDNFAGTQQYYLKGNIRQDTNGTEQTDALDDTYRTTIKSGPTVNYDTFVSQAFSCWNEAETSGVSSIESAKAAFKNVLSDVGCNYAGLDNNEKRLVRESRDGTYTKTGSRSGKAGLVDKESDSEGWNGLGITQETRPASWDTDQDGIPDWFETAKGWSTTTANNNTYDPTTYYTNLEDYLNWMAVPHFIGTAPGEGIPVGEAFTVALADYFAGYTSPSYAITGTANGAKISGTNLVITPTQGGQLLTVSVKATEGGISLTRQFNFYVAANEDQSGTVVEETGTITWALGTTTIGEGTYSNEVKDGFSSSGVSYDSGIFSLGSRTTDKDNNISYKVTSFAVTTLPTDGSPIYFYLTTKDGYTFTPSKIEYVATKIGTGGGNLTVDWVNSDNTTISIKDNYNITGRSNNGSSTYDIHYDVESEAISNAKASSGTCGLRFTVTNLSSSKSIGLANVIITGTLTHTETGAKTLTLDEEATSYTPEAMQNVTVTVRHPMGTGYWNTLCVPFDIPAVQIKSVFGEGTQVAAFTKANTESLHFDLVNEMSAGTPYLIKPTKAQDEYIFENVNVRDFGAGSSTVGEYSFQGTYVKYAMKTDGTEKGMTTANTLAKPKATANVMKGLRGYFVMSSSGSAKEVTIGDFEATRILRIDVDADAVFYDLQGRRVVNPVRGIYIRGGKKTVKN